MLIVGIAGLVIGIEHRYPYLEKHCAAYVTEGTPDFTVTVTDKMIETEKQNAVEIPAGADDGYFESLCAIREIAHRLPSYGAFLFHAVIEYKGEAIAFTAPSGTGKSTHIKNWRRAFGREVGIVNGDKPLIRVENKLVTAYGTPWSGKEGYNENFGVSLTAICFLEQGQQVSIRKIESEEYIRRLLPQTYFSTDRESLDKCGKLFARLCTLVPAYVLSATISQEAVRKAYDEISKG